MLIACIYFIYILEAELFKEKAKPAPVKKGLSHWINN